MKKKKKKKKKLKNIKIIIKVYWELMNNKVFLLYLLYIFLILKIIFCYLI